MVYSWKALKKEFFNLSTRISFSSNVHAFLSPYNKHSRMVFQWPVPSCLPSLPFQHSKRPTTAQSIAKLNPNQAEYHIQKAHETIHWFSAHLTYTIPIQNHATDQAKESHSRQHLSLPNASSRKRFIAPQFQAFIISFNLETLTYQRRQSILSSSLT